MDDSFPVGKESDVLQHVHQVYLRPLCNRPRGEGEEAVQYSAGGDFFCIHKVRLQYQSGWLMFC